MLILDSAQTHAVDTIAIEREGIKSISLMERAAQRLTERICEIFPNVENLSFMIFCGGGNNGGDGLAIARMLHSRGANVDCYELRCFSRYSSDNIANYNRLIPIGILHNISGADDFPKIDDGVVVIDCIFGSGLSRAITGLAAQLIQHINSSHATVVAIDVPSGLSHDNIPDTQTDAVVRAHYTLAIQSPFVSMLLPCNDNIVGHLSIVDIGLEPYFSTQKSLLHYLTLQDACGMYMPRRKFSHKGTFGHALIVAGSHGKGGAAVLCARACHRAGAGLVTAHIPSSLIDIMQISSPETMVSADCDGTCISQLPNLSPFRTVGVGPGIGKAPDTVAMLRALLNGFDRPMVLDADALNIIADNPDMLDLIPKNSIITPHPKEFERLFGKTANSMERLKLAMASATRLGIYIVLKGANTAICCPDGQVFFNSTGNPSMATAGSGDVLAGIITALLSQNYSPLHAALLGVFAHGLSADIVNVPQGLVASDIIGNLPEAFRMISQKNV